MSTLSTANIQTKAANTPPVIKDVNGAECGQFCRAWVNFDAGTGTTIRDSFNVDSITDHATGKQTVNFTNALPNANYSVVAQGNRLIADGAGGLYGLIMIDDSSAIPTTTAVRFHTIHTSGTAYDLDRICIAVFCN